MNKNTKIILISILSFVVVAALGFGIFTFISKDKGEDNLTNVEYNYIDGTADRSEALESLKDLYPDQDVEELEDFLDQQLTEQQYNVLNEAFTEAMGPVWDTAYVNPEDPDTIYYWTEKDGWGTMTIEGDNPLKMDEAESDAYTDAMIDMFYQKADGTYSDPVIVPERGEDPETGEGIDYEGIGAGEVEESEYPENPEAAKDSDGDGIPDIFEGQGTSIPGHNSDYTGDNFSGDVSSDTDHDYSGITIN